MSSLRIGGGSQNAGIPPQTSENVQLVTNGNNPSTPAAVTTHQCSSEIRQVVKASDAYDAARTWLPWAIKRREEVSRQFNEPSQSAEVPKTDEIDQARKEFSALQSKEEFIIRHLRSPTSDPTAKRSFQRDLHEVHTGMSRLRSKIDEHEAKENLERTQNELSTATRLLEECQNATASPK